MKHHFTLPSRLIVSMLSAVLGLMIALPAMADNVLQPNTESGIAEATYTWTDADGNVFGFSVLGNRYITSPFELILRGIVANPAVESTSITIPDQLLLDGKVMSVVSIYNGVFQEFTALTAVTLPATLGYINYEALNACTTLTDIYCRSILPPKIVDLDYSNSYNAVSAAILHVPGCVTGDYTTAPYWRDFTTIEALSEDLDRVNLYRAFTVTDLTGIAANADVRLTCNRIVPEGSYYYYNGPYDGDYGAHVDVNIPWQFGSFLMTQSIVYKNSGFTPIILEGYTSTLIPQSEMTATGDVMVQLDCHNDAWNFISFPFDVYMGDVSVSHNAAWVIRRFVPRERAALSGKAWQNVGPRDTLKANTGYIIYILTTNKDDTPTLTVKAADNAKKQGLFAMGDVTLPLTLTDAAVPQDRNWNFIGNPYPAFYDMGQSDFTAPYTIWSRTVGANTYEVYSPIDDDHVLQPFEAFFLQSPSDVSSITFNAAGRMHAMPATEDPYYAPRRARALQNRQLYNIFLSAGESSDRTRIVVNPEAKESYELECDASKMMTTNPAVSQIYVIDGGIQYAIDERPLGSGLFTLGALFTQDGDYTLRLETRGEAQPVALTDRLTGQTFDLSQGEEYTFHAEAGTTNGRFSLAIGDEATGIGSLTPNPSPKGEESIYDLSGRRISQPTSGIYVKGGKKFVIK